MVPCFLFLKIILMNQASPVAARSLDPGGFADKRTCRKAFPRLAGRPFLALRSVWCDTLTRAVSFQGSLSPRRMETPCQ